MAAEGERVRIPRSRDDDYTDEMAKRRRSFLAEQGRGELSHVSQYSVDPATLAGNVENFIDVAQVPIGLAGPLRINGEHAQGDFSVPMASTSCSRSASTRSGRFATCGSTTRRVTRPDRT